MAMPKPVVTSYGVCGNDLMFFESQRSSSCHIRHESWRTGLIRATGGSMTVPQFVEQLKYLVQGEFRWDVRESGKDIFKADLPSKADRLGSVNQVGHF